MTGGERKAEKRNAIEATAFVGHGTCPERVRVRYPAQAGKRRARRAVIDSAASSRAGRRHKRRSQRRRADERGAAQGCSRARPFGNHRYQRGTAAGPPRSARQAAPPPTQVGLLRKPLKRPTASLDDPVAQQRSRPRSGHVLSIWRTGCLRRPAIDKAIDLPHFEPVVEFQGLLLEHAVASRMRSASDPAFMIATASIRWPFMK